MNAHEALKRLREETLQLYPIGDDRVEKAKEYLHIIETELNKKPSEMTVVGGKVVVKWLIAKEIGELFDFAENTVRNYLKLYDIETKKEHGRRLISVSSFEKFMIDTGRMWER